jgi:hypothetical protein
LKPVDVPPSCGVDTFRAGLGIRVLFSTCVF